MKTCAVVIAAWKAQRWIGECLKSVRGQRGMASWRIEVRVAVDGCEATSAELRRLGVPHWWSATNVGPYILRNTLIERQPADCYAIFDADDIMRPTYLERTVRMARPHGIAGAARSTINERGRIIARRSRYQHGVSVIMHEAWKRVGGYRSYRVAADADLVARALALGVRVRAIPHPLYLRRRHADGLTIAPETRLGSDFREAVKEDFARRIAARELVVVPETVPLQWRKP